MERGKADVFTLMSHRNPWQELLTDRSLLPAALQELWRWIPSFGYGMPRPRWVSDDIEMRGGASVPAGDALILPAQPRGTAAALLKLRFCGPPLPPIAGFRCIARREIDMMRSA